MKQKPTFSYEVRFTVIASLKGFGKKKSSHYSSVPLDSVYYLEGFSGGDTAGKEKESVKIATTGHTYQWQPIGTGKHYETKTYFFL